MSVDSTILWLPPLTTDTQLHYNIIVLLHLTFIAFKYCTDEILVQKHNILEGITVLVLAQVLGSFVNVYIGVAVLCGSLWIIGSRIRYKPLPTGGKAVLITGKYRHTCQKNLLLKEIN